MCKQYRCPTGMHSWWCEVHCYGWSVYLQLQVVLVKKSSNYTCCRYLARLWLLSLNDCRGATGCVHLHVLQVVSEHISFYMHIESSQSNALCNRKLVVFANGQLSLYQVAECKVAKSSYVQFFLHHTWHQIWILQTSELPRELWTFVSIISSAWSPLSVGSEKSATNLDALIDAIIIIFDYGTLQIKYCKFGMKQKAKHAKLDNQRNKLKEKLLCWYFW